MTSLQFLFLGLALVWVLIGGYVLFLLDRQARLRARLEEVRTEIARLERAVDASRPARSRDPLTEPETDGRTGSPES